MTEKIVQKGKMIDPHDLAGVAPNAPMLLAFSGGADSMALLDMMQKEYPSAPILLAHVNHGIRGEEALRDRAFCENAAKARGLEIAILDADIPALAKEKGQSIEEAARDVRYAFFADLMKEREIPLLLTAHHADDHFETVLFRIARGTGLAGLRGIAPVRPFAQGFLVRPMLGFSKADILTYCTEHRVEFVTDSTNADTTYARNCIRAEVLPVLEGLYADASHRAVRMSADLDEDENCLREMAQTLVDRNTTTRGISVKALCEAHPAIRRRALEVWFEKERGAGLEWGHLQTLLRLLEKKDVTARVALPTSVSAYCTAQGRLALTKTKPEAVGEYLLPLKNGEQRVPNTDILIRITPIGEDAILDKEDSKTLVLFGKWEDLQTNYTWRNRREGDVIVRGNMHRQLRRLYAQAGVPVEMRRAMPLLCSGQDIVWAPFVGVSDEFKKQNAKGERSFAYKIEINVSDNVF